MIWFGLVQLERLKTEMSRIRAKEESQAGGLTEGQSNRLGELEKAISLLMEQVCQPIRAIDLTNKVLIHSTHRPTDLQRTAESLLHCVCHMSYQNTKGQLDLRG